MRVFADEGAELREPPLELVVEALLTGESPVEASEPRLKLLDNSELRVNGQPQGAHFRRLGGHDMFVELLDEADDHLGAFPVEFIELLTGEHRAITSLGRTMEVRGRAAKVSGSDSAGVAASYPFCREHLAPPEQLQ
jgi:hypothetical protein